MSYENYKASQKIAAHSFGAIIMGFMRVADHDNLSFLRSKYPYIWEELKARYNAPGGKLEGEE
jgi:hypothetical protein